MATEHQDHSSSCEHSDEKGAHSQAVQSSNTEQVHEKEFHSQPVHSSGCEHPHEKGLHSHPVHQARHSHHPVSHSHGTCDHQHDHSAFHSHHYHHVTPDEAAQYKRLFALALCVNLAFVVFATFLSTSCKTTQLGTSGRID